MIREVVYVDEAETQPQPEVVQFVIKNPLCQKKNEVLLLENEVTVRKEINAWWLGWMRRLLPAGMYAKAVSHNPQEFYEAARYMAKHGIRFDNPGGRSLERHAYNEGRIVGIFRIELQNTI